MVLKAEVINMKNLRIFYILILFIILSACLGCKKKPSNHNAAQRQINPTHNHRYQSSCVFCNIYLGKAPSQIFFQNNLITAFRDTNPQPIVHTLVIPNDHIINLADIADKNKVLLGNMLVEIVKLGSNQCPNGFRVITNTGKGAHQTIFHLHFHILGGRDVGVFPEVPILDTTNPLYTDTDIIAYNCLNSKYSPHIIISLALAKKMDIHLWGKILEKIKHYGHTDFGNNYRTIINFGENAHQEDSQNLYIHIIGTKGAEIPLFAFSEPH